MNDIISHKGEENMAKEYKSGTKKYYIDKDGYKRNRKNTDKLTNEYKKRTYEAYTFRVRKDETDVIEKLASVESKAQYIIELIRKDIADK